MKLLIYSQTSTVEQLKFGNGLVISSPTLLNICFLIHAGIKVGGRASHLRCAAASLRLAFLRNRHFVRGIHQSLVNSLHKGPVMQNVDGSFVVGPNKLFSILLIYRWLEMAWRSCDVTAMRIAFIETLQAYFTVNAPLLVKINLEWDYIDMTWYELTRKKWSEPP